ncbi:hypothetical protein E2562_006174 [Oryza meyeriana var. granulata]|uniref:Uncharacterized protein n=1 Tax=Oryza meyeriana var. granulata TaxID=110450 RepID=A0A6G1CPF5_9ORYZ|nr:hypothetical protein E2562_006174 [Oryza meyeriana var. granulata]
MKILCRADLYLRHDESSKRQIVRNLPWGHLPLPDMVTHIASFIAPPSSEKDGTLDREDPRSEEERGSGEVRGPEKCGRKGI